MPDVGRDGIFNGNNFVGMTKSSGYHILRVGMGLTFLWIGVLILQDPTFWGGFLKPWAVNLLPVPLHEAMISTAVLDILIGFFLLIDVVTWIAAAFGSIHLLIILITAGIDSITVRDIGLLGGCISLFWSDLPKRHREAIVRTTPTP